MWPSKYQLFTFGFCCCCFFFLLFWLLFSTLETKFAQNRLECCDDKCLSKQKHTKTHNHHDSNSVNRLYMMCKSVFVWRKKIVCMFERWSVCFTPCSFVVRFIFVKVKKINRHISYLVAKHSFYRAPKIQSTYVEWAQTHRQTCPTCISLLVWNP